MPNFSHSFAYVLVLFVLWPDWGLRFIDETRRKRTSLTLPVVSKAGHVRDSGMMFLTLVCRVS